MKLQPLPPGFRSTVTPSTRKTLAALPLPSPPSLPASLSTFSTFAFFLLLFFVLVVLLLSSPPPSFPVLLVHTRGGERDSFQLVWSLRASVYPLQKAALNLRRNLLRPGSFKEEFSSYWRRIFLLALTR